MRAGPAGPGSSGGEVDEGLLGRPSVLPESLQPAAAASEAAAPTAATGSGTSEGAAVEQREIEAALGRANVAVINKEIDRQTRMPGVGANPESLTPQQWIERYFAAKNKEHTLKAILKYLKTSSDPEILDATYKSFVEVTDYSARPNLEGIRNAMDEVALRLPAVKNKKPEDFVNTRFLLELEKEGFFKSLSK